jgi:hypothetical protein
MLSTNMHQVAIWTNSHVSKPVLWNPVRNGWRQQQCTDADIIEKKRSTRGGRRFDTSALCDKNGCKDIVLRQNTQGTDLWTGVLE